MGEKKLKDIKKKIPKSSYQNRGLKFEEKIQHKCDELRKNKVALLSKVPTEWKVVRRGAYIVKAFTVAESRFVDFVGCNNKGQAIGIEAKETSNKTSFPFGNIKESQFSFFGLWCGLGAIGYYIVHFKEHEKVFLVKATDLEEIKDTIGRKSVPYKMFCEDDRFIELDYEKLNFEDYINNIKK